MGVFDKVGGALSGSAIGSVLLGPVGGAIGAFKGAEKGLGGVGKSVSGFFDGLSKYDPTAIRKANVSGVDAAQDELKKAGAKASDFANALRANPTQAQQVTAAAPGQASTISAPQQVQAQQIAAGLAQSQNVSAAQIAPVQQAQAAIIERADEQAIRAQQAGLANALQAQAAGTAPSLAEQQLARQNEQAVRQQLALAGSQRGITPAMAQRQAAMNIASLSAEQGQRAAELRIQEQQAARGQLADVLGQTRNMDVNLAGQQAQFQQQAGLQNAETDAQRALAQAQLTQQAGLANQSEFGTTSRFNVGTDLQAQQSNAQLGLAAQTTNAGNVMQAQQFNAKAADEMARFNADAGLRVQIANQAAELQARGMDNAQIAQYLGIEQASLSSVLSSQGQQFASEQARQNAQGAAKTQMLGNVIGAGAAVGAKLASDAANKKNIRSGEKDMRAFVDALDAHTYEYKNSNIDGAAPGKRYGIMAQALERSAAGKSIVRETPEGKKVDVAQGLGVALAALAAMNKRLGKVEGKRS